MDICRHVLTICLPRLLFLLRRIEHMRSETEDVRTDRTVVPQTEDVRWAVAKELTFAESKTWVPLIVPLAEAGEASKGVSFF
jgi:hypothetical protein